MEDKTRSEDIKATCMADQAQSQSGSDTRYGGTKATCITVQADKERCAKSSIEISGLWAMVVGEGPMLRINGDATGGYDATMRFPLVAFR